MGHVHAGTAIPAIVPSAGCDDASMAAMTRSPYHRGGRPFARPLASVPRSYAEGDERLGG